MESFKLQSICGMVLALASLYTSVQTADTTAYTVCPVNNQKFLSTDQSLLPPANIQATSEDTLFNPVENFIAPDSPPWCTAENEGTMPGHSIELTFTEPVVIELLQSSGFFNGYVNNFTILYTMSVTENDFNSYGILEQSQSFLTDSPLIDEGYFSMEQPIVARRLKFAINDGVIERQANRLCWEIALYGCTLQAARTIQSTGTSEPTSTTARVLETSRPTDQISQTETTSMETECPQDNTSVAFSRTDILMIAMPIALATIVIVLFIVILGIIICICVTRRRDDLNKQDYDTVTVKMLNNRTRQIIEGGEITPNSATNFHYDSPRILSYDVPRTAQSRSRGNSVSMSSTDALNSPLSVEIRNPVYSIKRSPPENPLQLALMNMADTSSCGNDYETIPDRDAITSQENKMYGLQRSTSQPPQGRPPPNSNVTTTTRVSIASSSDISVMKEKLGASESGSIGSGRSSSTLGKLPTYDYATVDKAGMKSNRTGSEPPRETNMTETL